MMLRSNSSLISDFVLTKADEFEGVSPDSTVSVFCSKSYRAASLAYLSVLLLYNVDSVIEIFSRLLLKTSDPHIIYRIYRM